MKYKKLQKQLIETPKVWLVTGVAGFIGSNLLEALLQLNQTVIGLDNFATGHKKNIDQVRNAVTTGMWKNFSFIEGDIRSFEQCRSAVRGVDYVLHQAALGSVPRSIADPLSTNECNINGFVNILEASRLEKVTNFVYAASSSTYGDHPALPKVEENIGKPLSPYGLTKYVNELYSEIYSTTYGFHSIGLRYFNVFGKRQDPDGAYAAVIPKWISALLRNDTVFINGDGQTSRDFCYIENVVQMNILAAMTNHQNKSNVYNVAVGQRTTLDELYNLIKDSLTDNGIQVYSQPAYRDFRQGDVRHSQADISKAKSLLGYEYNYCFTIKITEHISLHCY